MDFELNPDCAISDVLDKIMDEERKKRLKNMGMPVKEESCSKESSSDISNQIWSKFGAFRNFPQPLESSHGGLSGTNKMTESPGIMSPDPLSGHLRNCESSRLRTIEKTPSKERKTEIPFLRVSDKNKVLREREIGKELSGQRDIDKTFSRQRGQRERAVSRVGDIEKPVFSNNQSHSIEYPLNQKPNYLLTKTLPGESENQNFFGNPPKSKNHLNIPLHESSPKSSNPVFFARPISDSKLRQTEENFVWNEKKIFTPILAPETRISTPLPAPPSLPKQLVSHSHSHSPPYQQAFPTPMPHSSLKSTNSNSSHNSLSSFPPPPLPASPPPELYIYTKPPEPKEPPPESPTKVKQNYSSKERQSNRQERNSSTQVELGKFSPTLKHEFHNVNLLKPKSVNKNKQSTTYKSSNKKGKFNIKIHKNMSDDKKNLKSSIYSNPPPIFKPNIDNNNFAEEGKAFPPPEFVSSGSLPPFSPFGPTPFLERPQFSQMSQNPPFNPMREPASFLPTARPPFYPPDGKPFSTMELGNPFPPMGIRPHFQPHYGVPPPPFHPMGGGHPQFQPIPRFGIVGDGVPPPFQPMVGKATAKLPAFDSRDLMTGYKDVGEKKYRNDQQNSNCEDNEFIHNKPSLSTNKAKKRRHTKDSESRATSDRRQESKSKRDSECEYKHSSKSIHARPFKSSETKGKSSKRLTDHDLKNNEKISNKSRKKVDHSDLQIVKKIKSRKKLIEYDLEPGEYISGLDSDDESSSTDSSTDFKSSETESDSEDSSISQSDHSRSSFKRYMGNKSLKYGSYKKDLSNSSTDDDTSDNSLKSPIKEKPKFPRYFKDKVAYIADIPKLFDEKDISGTSKTVKESSSVEGKLKTSDHLEPVSLKSHSPPIASESLKATKTPLSKRLGLVEHIADSYSYENDGHTDYQPDYTEIGEYPEKSRGGYFMNFVPPSPPGAPPGEGNSDASNSDDPVSSKMPHSPCNSDPQSIRYQYRSNSLSPDNSLDSEELRLLASTKEILSASKSIFKSPTSPKITTTKKQYEKPIIKVETANKPDPYLKHIQESPLRVDLDSRLKSMFGMKKWQEDSPEKRTLRNAAFNHKSMRMLSRPPSPFRSKNAYQFWYRETYYFRKHNPLPRDFADPTDRRKIGVQIKMADLFSKLDDSVSKRDEFTDSHKEGMENPLSLLSNFEETSQLKEISVPEVNDQLRQKSSCEQIEKVSQVDSGIKSCKNLDILKVNVTPETEMELATAEIDNGTNTSLCGQSSEEIKDGINASMSGEVCGKINLPIFGVISEEVKHGLNNSSANLGSDKCNSESEILCAVMNRIVEELKSSIMNKLTEDILKEKLNFL